MGLVAAVAAAVTVYVLGGRDGGQDWQVPALVLVGVLVLVVHAATIPGPQAPGPPVPGPVPPTPASRSAHHLPDPGTAELSPPATALGVVMPGAAGLPEVVVPPSAFPDAGHSHGPVHAVIDTPPPLHAVLAPPSGPPSTAPPPTPSTTSSPTAPPAAPPPPGAVPPPFDPTSPDSVQVDLTTTAGEPLVYRVLPGPPPPPGSRADEHAPGVGPPDGDPPAG